MLTLLRMAVSSGDEQSNAASCACFDSTSPDDGYVQGGDEEGKGLALLIYLSGP